jgi:hypothetical protein
VLRKCIKIAEGKNRAVYLDQANSNAIMDILKSDEKLEKKFMERVELIIISSDHLLTGKSMKNSAHLNQFGKSGYLNKVKGEIIGSIVNKSRVKIALYM